MDRDQIIGIWRATSPSTILSEEGLRICKAVAEAEREASAKVCEEWDSDSADPREVAATIRARGQ
jgi:hypothetical protein